jgi:MFS family permease
MLNGTFYEKFGITARSALTNIVLLANVFVWYYYALANLQIIIQNIASDFFVTLQMWSIHFVGVTFSALAGALLAAKMERRTLFLILWMALGVASPFALATMNTADASCVLILSFLFGLSLGLGMPNCMGYYTACTNVENRARLGGIVMIVSGLGMLLLGMTAIENIALRALTLAVWRASGLVLFLLIKPHEVIRGKNEHPSYRFLFSQLSFVLYLVPWIMFSSAAYLVLPVQSNILGESLIEFLMILGNGFQGVFAIVGGFLSDSVGRKRVAIAGFVMLGLGYSILGIYPENLFSWYFYTVADSIAWGFFFVIFVITIWGDLSYGAPSDKYYAVGVLPFFVSKFLQLTIGEYVAAIIPPHAIFSFTAFFLFLAVIPLMYAPETLPEKKIRERELRQYIEKAKKIKEKYT